MENTTITDKELVIKVRDSNCNTSLKTLIHKHSALCFDICKKYSNAISKNGLRVEDVTQEKEFIIYKSAMSFNPDKGAKFSTWLGNQIRYNCLNKINKSRPHMLLEDEESDFLIEKNDEPDFLEIKEYVLNIMKIHSKSGKIIQGPKPLFEDSNASMWYSDK